MRFVYFFVFCFFTYEKQNCKGIIFKKLCRQPTFLRLQENASQRVLLYIPKCVLNEYKNFNYN